MKKFRFATWCCLVAMVLNTTVVSAQGLFRTEVKNRYDLKTVSCYTCHARVPVGTENPKQFRNDLGKVFDALLKGIVKKSLREFVFFEKEGDAGEQSLFARQGEQDIGGLFGGVVSSVLFGVNGQGIPDGVFFIEINLAFPRRSLFDDKRAVFGQVGGYIAFLPRFRIDETQVTQRAVFFVVEKRFGKKPAGELFQVERRHCRLGLHG